MLLLVLYFYQSLFVLVSGNSSSFEDKTNKDLHCKLGNKEKFTELSITPGKHIYNDAAGDTYVYNGATITVKCVDPKLTFTNGVVKVVGERTDYKLYKYVIVQCMYSTVIVPDMFQVEKFCAAGCPDPDLSSTHYKVDPERNSEDKEDKAPFDEGEYTVTCRDGYVRAWKDDGDSTFTCKDSKFDKTQAQLVTCAPGCLDLYNDILPYRRALAIVPYKSKDKISTPLNMIWPGAPYPHGAKLYFTCYGGDNNDLKTDGNDPLYCYTNKDGGDCGSDCTAELGWWNKEAPKCKWES